MPVPASELRASTAYFFEMARVQAAPLSLTFLLDKCEVSRLSAPCVMVKNGHFVVRAELDQLAAHPLIWGAEVRGYFTVTRGKPLPCHFATRLARLYNGPLNSMYLVFPLPESFDHNQRRFSKRVSLDGEAASGLGVWHGSLAGGGPELLPELVWTPLAGEDCELGELSASGMRLDVRESSALCSRLAVNDPVLLRGDFSMTGTPNPIYVRGVIVRSMPRLDEEGIIGFGCHFLAWRKVVSPIANTWFRADEQDGLGSIAEWLARKFRTVSS